MGEKIETAAEAHEASAMPRVHEVHSDPKAKNAKDQAVPKGVSDKPVEKKSSAQWAYERTVLYLKKFEEGLETIFETYRCFRRIRKFEDSWGPGFPSLFKEQNSEHSMKG